MEQNVSNWMDQYSRRHVTWYVKRLSANDTQATGAHQGGPLVSKRIAFKVLPELKRETVKNPDVRFDLFVDSHSDDRRRARMVWYNNRLHQDPRAGKISRSPKDEVRMTRLGGQQSALLDPDNTGALTVFAFVGLDDGTAQCHTWICRSFLEEELVENYLTGPLEPGKHAVWVPFHEGLPTQYPAPKETIRGCWLQPGEVPSGWLKKFPAGEILARRAIQLLPAGETGSDARMLQRRDCEYELFQSVEAAAELPVIRKGFSSMSGFLSKANSVLQRRKSRAGRSLELHVREILIEEGLQPEHDFEHGVESEPLRKPDFLFPSQAKYRDPDFPESKLRMLAVKTTCRDRWRQILNEADRIRMKHLLTLDRAVSENQFREMVASGVQLVVPKPLGGSYPKALQPQVITLEDFIQEIKSL